jgi:hypothetical protein
MIPSWCHQELKYRPGDGRCNTDRSECIVCAEERRELSLPAAAGGLKTIDYGRMATHRPGGVLPGSHSPSPPPRPTADEAIVIIYLCAKVLVFEVSQWCVPYSVCTYGLMIKPAISARGF